jgi:hypothetical protein
MLLVLPATIKNKLKRLLVGTSGLTQLRYINFLVKLSELDLIKKNIFSGKNTLMLNFINIKGKSLIF